MNNPYRPLRYLFALLFLFILVGRAGASEPIPGPPVLSATCATELPPGDPGDYAGMPGGWHNFKRYGTGWSFLNANRPTGINEMLVTWHTFHPGTGRPIWLTTINSPFTIEPNGERRWSSVLQEATATYTAQGFTKTLTDVGAVTIVFPPGSATRAAVRWRWNAVDNNEHDECLYNFFREPNPSNAPEVAGSVNESYTSGWFEEATSGWGINFEAGTDLSGNYAEVSSIDMYDSQGRPMWLYAQTNTSEWRPTTWQESNLYYFKGLYNITQDCTTEADCRVRTDLNTPVNRFGRAFQSPFNATFLVKASATVGSQSFNWPLATFPAPNPNPPAGCPTGQNCRPMTRLTDGEQIVLSQTQCYIPPGGSNCTVLVSWISSDDATIHRVNLNNGAVTQIGSGVTGEVTQTLVNGDRFKYLIKKAGVTTFESPEVKGIGQQGPLPEIFPTLPSIPGYVNPANAVGYTGGEFRVDEGGAATYRIPVYAPKGRGNLTPGFSVAYNSGGGDGLMGPGWTLQGVSVISRCRFTLETDGHNERMGDSAETHGFCLDGQRLVKVAGVNGQTNAEYRTEVDSYQKIVVNGHESYLGGWQPTSFTVYGKDGSRRTFGGGTSQRRRTNGSASYIVEWWESSRRDTTNNEVTYSYVGDSSTGSFVLGEATYVGGRISFQYTQRAFPSVTYYNKLKLTQLKRLDHIYVYAANQTEELRRYNMGYEAVPLNGALSRLAQIQECVGSSCLKPTVFDWYDQPAANQGDLEYGVGTTEFVNLKTFKLGDVNGDGLADIVWVGDNQFLRVTFSQPNASANAFGSTTVVTTIEGANDQRSRTWGLIDYNADGRDDLLIYKNGLWAVWLSDGNTFVNSGITIPNSGTFTGRTPELLVSDFSGDGLPDMLVYEGRGSLGPMAYAWIMERETNPTAGQPYRFSSRYNIDIQGLSCGSVSFPEFDVTRSEALDVNGDGQSDLMLRSDPCFAEAPPIKPDTKTVSIKSGEVQLPPASSIDWIGMDEWPVGRSVPSPTGATSGSIGIFQLTSIDAPAGGSPGVLHFNLMTTPWQENVNLNSFRLLDINGDGYADAIWNLPDSQNWKYSLNNGAGFADVKCVLGSAFPNCDAAAGSTYGVQIADFNGDGRLDFWVRTAPTLPGDDDHKYAVHIWTGDGFSPTPIQTAHQSGGIPWVRSIADIDGDGYPDTLRIRVDNEHSWKVQRSNKHHQPRNVIKTISQGLGAVTTISYAPMTFKSVYGRAYDGSSIASGRGSPVLDVLAPRYVVSRVVSSAPTDTNASAGAEIRYRYEGLRMQGGGRGSLGFKRIYTLADTADPAQKLETITEYEQRFPLAGLPKSTRVIKDGSWLDVCGPDSSPNPAGVGCMSYGGLTPPSVLRTVLNQSDDTWRWRFAGSAALDPPLSGDFRPILVEKRLSTSTKRDLVNALLSTVSTSLTYDDYGSVLSSTATNGNGELIFNQIRSVQTTNLYDADDTANWILGRLTSSVVTTTRYGSSGNVLSANTRSTAYEYEPTTGLLTVERVQPNGGASEKLSTFYQYDAYGNQIAKRTCSGNVSDPVCKALDNSTIVFRPSSSTIRRYSRTQMDSNRIYSTATIEPFNSNAGVDLAGSTEKNVAVVVRDAYGNPTQTTGVNGSIELAAYDAFGRMRFAGNSTGASATTTRMWCADTSCPTFGGGASYVVIQSPAGGAKTWTYFDRLDREMLVVTEAFGSSLYSAVKKTYDEQGRPKKVSEPYYTFNPNSSSVGTASGGSIHMTTTTYDALGRVIRIDHPNGSATTINISGLTTVTTLPQNIGNGSVGISETRTEIQNLLGETAETRDHNGTKLKFEFDAVGNIVKTSRVTPGGTTYDTLTPYDTLGRRTSLTDGDTGTWTTEYNAAGEAIFERSGQTCSASLYDARGRVWTRSDYNNAACTGTAETITEWHYDTSPSHTGYGQLDYVTTSDGSGSGMAPINYMRTEVHDSMGRVKSVETQIGSATYVERKTFDAVGRPRQVFFSGTNIPESGELLQYDTKGYPKIVRDVMDGASGRIYHEVTQRNARGQVTEERRADNAALMTSRSYASSTGWLTGIVTTNLENLVYQYDDSGNVSHRYDQSPGTYIHEEYEYDGLQRLTRVKHRNSNGSLRTSVDFAYDALGNRSPGSGSGSATYGTKASYCNASERVPGSGALSILNGTQYCYDGRGNRVRSISSGGVQQQSVKYTAYGQVREAISTVTNAPGHVTRYFYGPERQRIRRLDYFNSSATGSADTADEVGNAEIITRMASTVREVRRSLGAVILNRIVTSSGVVIGSQDRFVFTDAQGSPHRITSADGAVLGSEASRWFSAFGARANKANGDQLTIIQVMNEAADAITRQSYTGHESADGVGLIHMNGRMYDPIAGRFLQADPFVQDPGNTQSFNRYSYVFNNPLVHTDPTGYWGAREQGALRTVVAIAITVCTGVYISSLGATITTTQAAGIAAAGGAAAGAVQTGTLRGAVVGAFSGFVGYRIGVQFRGSEGSFGHVFAHATLGGVTAELNGGKFGHGFVAAGFSTALDPTIDTGSSYGDGFLHAMLGGTVSELSGGKFANGAITAAFSFGLNQLTEREIVRNTIKVELIESLPTEDFDTYANRVGQRLVDLAKQTGFEHTISFGSRNDPTFKDGRQYGGWIQTQRSHVFSVAVYRAKGYTPLHNTSGYELRLHSHGYSEDAMGKGISANDMDIAYKPRTGSGRNTRPMVPNQDRYHFSADDAATRGGLAYPGGIMWWPGESHD